MATVHVHTSGKEGGEAHRPTLWESSLPFVLRQQNLPRKTMPAASQLSCGNLQA